MLNLFFLFFSSALLCLLLTAPWVWLLKTFKVGQNIRKEGPARHGAKAGTPTLGGIPLFLTILILSLIFIDFQPGLFLILIPTLGYGLLGLLDDLIKIFRRENLGLGINEKFLGQILLALIFAGGLLYAGANGSLTGVLKSLHFDFPLLYLLFIAFLTVGTANAVNLTDGLDGLAAGTSALAFLAYAVIAYKLSLPEVAAFCVIVSGAALAFLYFNFYPARLFLGDVGSLGLGGALAAVAASIHRELLLLLIGGVFAVEALSVIVQVAVYKKTGRRIFKMAPLHHHFELSGFSEPKIVIGFSLAGAVLALLGVLLA